MFFFGGGGSVADAARRFFFTLSPTTARPPHPLSTTTAPKRPPAISSNKEYSDLKKLVDRAELAKELGAGFSGTLFAPSNAAFDAVARAGGPKVSDFLDGSPSDLKKLVLFHVAQQKLTAADLTKGKTIETKLPGAKLQVVSPPAAGGKVAGVEIKPASYSGKAAGPSGNEVTAGNAALFPINTVLAPGKEDIKASVEGI